HRVDVLAGHVVDQGDRGIAGMRPVLAADMQLAVQYDPVGDQLDIAIVREAELAVDRQAAKRGRADIEHHFPVSVDDDGLAFTRYPAVGPGRRIGPKRSLSRGIGVAPEQEARGYG